MKLLNQKARVVLFLFALMASQCASVWGNPRLKHGVYREYYGNGALRMKTRYKKGTIIYRQIFFRHGRLSKESVYKKGDLVKLRTFYDDGQLKSLWIKKKEEARYYNRDGSLKTIVQDFPNKDLVDRLPESLF